MPVCGSYCVKVYEEVHCKTFQELNHTILLFLEDKKTGVVLSGDALEPLVRRPKPAGAGLGEVYLVDETLPVRQSETLSINTGLYSFNFLVNIYQCVHILPIFH